MNSPIQLDRTDRGASRIAAIVLAAGYSSRMVAFKPLLRLGGVTAFERCIDVFRRGGVDDVIVVLGHRADELRPIAEQYGARCTVNPHFDRGMFTSIVAGSHTVAKQSAAVFVLPVDIPLIHFATIRRLRAAWSSGAADIVYPVFDGQRGHPPLISREILEEATTAGEGPLSALLDKYEGRSIEVLVDDEAIHLDMDTKADYESLVALAAQRDFGESMGIA